MTQAATWDRSGIRVGIVVAVIAKVAGVVVLFNWSGHTLDPFDLTKSVYSRALEWTLLALLVVALMSYGAGILPRTRLHLAGR